MILQVPQHLAPLRVIVPMQKHLPTWLLRITPRCPRGPPQRKHIRNHPGRPNSPRSGFQRSFVGLFVGTEWPNNHPKKIGVILEYLRSTPHPVTVTTRIITFLVGNPYKPSFATVTGWGVVPRNTLPGNEKTYPTLGYVGKSWTQKCLFPKGIDGGYMLPATPTPPKTNMEPENGPLEKEITIGNHHFQVPC